jgi:hypothetical protein
LPLLAQHFLRRFSRELGKEVDRVTPEKKSLARVVQHFRGHHLTIPRRDRYGAIQWKRPTIANLGSMVKNPAYAGAFVRSYGVK